MVDGFELLLFITLQFSFAFGFLWCASQVHSSFLIDILLLRNFLPDLLISLLEAFNIRVESTHVLVDEEVLLLLFEEGFSDFLQVLNATFFLDLFKVLEDKVHVSFVLIDYLDFIFVFGDEVSQS